MTAQDQGVQAQSAQGKRRSIADEPRDAIPKPVLKDDKMRTGRDWTVEEDDQLRQLLVKGEYLQVIARQMGRTQGAISGRAGKMKLRVRSAPGRRRSADLSLPFPKSL